MTMPEKTKRMRIAKDAPPVARFVRVRSANEKRRKGASPKGAIAEQPPVYLVLAHGVGEEPAHSVIEVTAGGAARPLHNISSGMSFAAVRTRDGPRIVGVGVGGTTVYDPKTSTEVAVFRLLEPMVNPVLISAGGKLYALSRSPAVVQGTDFMPWFFSININNHRDVWGFLPPPPIFPCRLNPLEYRDPPAVRVAAYALVGSHILLSVEQDKGTCAFDLDAKQWEMVDDKNLPFTGEAVPLGDHRFVACSKARDGAVAVYHMEVFPPAASCTGKKELSIVELNVASSSRIVPGHQHLLCAMGKGSFSSLQVRSIDSPAKLDKARVVHRTYSQVEADNLFVIEKKDRQIYKLRDPCGCLAQPSWAVAALTMGE